MKLSLRYSLQTYYPYSPSPLTARFRRRSVTDVLIAEYCRNLTLDHNPDTAVMLIKRYFGYTYPARSSNYKMFQVRQVLEFRG